jgi:hypothetical protein
MIARFVEIDSPEYLSLCDLRYRVFFQERRLPREIIFDQYEDISWYAVITMANSSSVLACGRLTPLASNQYQISQMAVEPSWQGQKLGGAIMTALLEKAIDSGAKVLVVDARTSAIGFYERFGFVVMSEEFPSSKTGIPHVIMQRTS